ncbi:YjcZ family sporulation protein [Paenibacillus sp. 1_12]|nr:YjcZ family sporulation protein [Paenibacillus sp. 1_12]
MAHVGGVGAGGCASPYGGFGTSTGEILVLFILLVIITGAGFWGV